MDQYLPIINKNQLIKNKESFVTKKINEILKKINTSIESYSQSPVYSNKIEVEYEIDKSWFNENVCQVIKNEVKKAGFNASIELKKNSRNQYTAGYGCHSYLEDYFYLYIVLTWI